MDGTADLDFPEQRKTARDGGQMMFDAEFRAEGDGGLIVGYAAVFNSLSEDLGGFREIIRPGAFTKTLQETKDVAAFFNHDTSYILGRTSNRTLRVFEDDRGLRFEVNPPDTQWARDLMVSIRRGDISRMSFGMKVRKDNWRKDSNDTGVLRELLEVNLFEVSPVTLPAYPSTSVFARSFYGVDVSRFTPDQIRAALETINTQPEPLGTTEQQPEPEALATTPSDLEANHDRLNSLRRAASMLLE